MFSAITREEVTARVSAAMWGVTVTRGCDQKGWSCGRGSTRNASSVAWAEWAGSKAARGADARGSFGSALGNGQVWLLGFISFLVILGIYAMSFWQPTMLQSMGLSVMQIGLYSVVPAVAGIAATLIIAGHSDRRQERRWHFAGCPLDWCRQRGVKLDFRHFPDGYVATAADVEAELKRTGVTLQPLDIVVVNTSAGARYGQPDYVGRGCGMGREATLYLTERGVRITGTQVDEQLGWSIADGGDARADGVSDLLIGAPFYNADIRTDAGRVIEVSDRPDRRNRRADSSGS